ncbi:MAG: KTSC domain-containing protein [Balneolaceae bacterium]|nr:KTSC domain-containing protein [Balneolaceae bacterium]
MEIVNVDSSMIVSIGYDQNNATLQIIFKSDHSVWHYYDVSENLFRDFQYSGSKGKFFHRRIKGNYPEVRVG